MIDFNMVKLRSKREQTHQRGSGTRPKAKKEDDLLLYAHWAVFRVHMEAVNPLELVAFLPMARNMSLPCSISQVIRVTII